MSLEILYQWREEIANRLGLGKWSSLGLALFSIGIVLAERCTLSKVSERLAMMGKADTVERRLQRLLSQTKVEMTVCLPAWVKWVVSCLSSDEVVLLVDETKLGEHLGVMMVGLAYRSRCIPLAWRCYVGTQYPAEGQVALIAQLLRLVQAGLPPGCVPLVEADRGIGTSPRLVEAVMALGWHYLFRVQSSTKLVTCQGRQHTLGDLVKPGEQWSGHGSVFKQRGRVTAFVHVLWDLDYAEPWCLITNASPLDGRLYAVRNWQEQGFRDLKGGGWQWQRSQVWLPDHADRLLLALALAYAWVLTHGTWIAEADEEVRHLVTRGTQRIYSLFREGLRYLTHALATGKMVYVGLLLAPDKPLCPNLS